jgi:hypothetical protein
MAERAAKSWKNSWATCAGVERVSTRALFMRRGTGTCGDTAGAGCERDRGRARDSGRVGVHASRGGWVGQPSVDSTFRSRWWTNGSITLDDIYITVDLTYNSSKWYGLSKNITIPTTTYSLHLIGKRHVESCFICIYMLPSLSTLT